MSKIYTYICRLLKDITVVLQSIPLSMCQVWVQRGGQRAAAADPGQPAQLPGPPAPRLLLAAQLPRPVRPRQTEERSPTVFWLKRLMLNFWIRNMKM